MIITSHILSATQASAFARVALTNIVREYPNKLDHVLNGDGDARSPHALHPLFFGSFDWHSAVHMHWLLVRLLRLQPHLPEATEISTLLEVQFSIANVAEEINYLQQPSRASFERTYGWAWLLKLQTELLLLAPLSAAAARWSNLLQPLADVFVGLYLAFLPRAQFAIRAGTHANSAFGLLFALEYARLVNHDQLRACCIERARHWFAADKIYPAAYEPSGDDFLSGGLVEAALMHQVLDSNEFLHWWDGFCPLPESLAGWLQPVHVSDRSDPKFSHLDGLNLSRAWSWKSIQTALPAPLDTRVLAAIEAQLAASLPHAVAGDYVGTHWLASFATLALT